MNKHIEKYLDQYLNHPNPDYAVMLTGEWGCGKTFFIKNYIEERNKNTKWCLKKGKKLRYISLNGISSTSAIISSMLFNTHHVFSWLKIIWSLLKCFSLTGKNVNFSPQDIYITELFGKITKHNILFFDDLERCKIEPIELLGFINNLVESQHLHVIIIGDETHIHNEIKDCYSVRKEKVIGKTFNIQSQDADVLPELIKEFTDTGLEDLLQEHLDAILLSIDEVNKYCKREQVNYRIIKAAIREFHFAFEGVFKNDQLKEYKSKIFAELFGRFLVVFYCLQTKSLDLEEVWSCAKYFPLDDEKTDKVMDFRKAFPFWIGDTFIDSEHWINIFEHKPVNASDLIDHIHDRMNPVVPNWKKLLLFYEMDDKDIETTHKAVLKEISEQEHRNPFVILHIFMTLVAMSQKGFINTQTSEIVSEAKKYLDSIGNNLSWNDVSADINFYWEGYDGYGYHALHSNEFKEISAYLEMKMREKCKENIDKCYQNFITDITNEERAYVKICSPDYQRADIFTDSNPLTLWDKLISLTPKAFREITHYMNDEVIRHHLCNKRSPKQFDFWKKIISLGENFLNEHPHDNKAKCLHLREDFLPELRKMVSEYEQQ